MITARAMFESGRVIEINGRGSTMKLLQVSAGGCWQKQGWRSRAHNALCSTLFLLLCGNNALQYYCCLY
jgi:hypothetical protein